MRCVVAFLVVTSVTFFKIFSDPVMKLLSCILFFISAEMYSLTTLVPMLLSYLVILRSSHEVMWIPIPKEVIDLAHRMRVKVKKLGIHLSLYNAYTKGSSIIIGKALLDRLNVEESCAIIAHELSHIKRRPVEIIIKSTYLIPISLSIISWTSLPYVMFLLGALAYMVVLITPLNWLFELLADIDAAKYVGKEHIKSALLALAIDKRKLNEPSETHPPIIKRIKNIEQLD